MTPSDKPPKGGAPKPFLGEAELSSELDAWDEMFDNLHAGPSEGVATEEPPMDWPAPTTELVPPTSRVPDNTLTALDASRTLEDFPPPGPGPWQGARGDTDLDDQMSLDRAVEESPRTTQPRIKDWQAPKGDETDFGSVGASQQPAALGEILRGGPPDVPRWGDDDEPSSETRIMPPDPEVVRGPVVPLDSLDDDDAVYTSASRPNVKQAHDDLALPEDPVAPPPSARSSAPTAPPVTRRTGPAIIRRQTPLSIPAVPPSVTGQQPAEPPDDLAESTRIADVSELDDHVEETRRAPDRSKAPTAPPPMSFAPTTYEQPAARDDDYEIEIGANEDEPVQPVADIGSRPVPGAPRRTVAHVVRRTEASKAQTAPPPMRASQPAISDAIPREAAAEDDFSDVAAAVGATDDLQRDAPVMLHHAPTSLRDYDEDAEIDDAVPTTMEDDEVDVAASGDAYVPMHPGLDDQLDVPVEEPAIESSVEMAVEQIDDEDAMPITGSGDRPPALMDLYPRVKRPTSVPAMMQPTPSRANRAQSIGDEQPEIEPVIDVETIGADSQWPEQQAPLASSQLDEDAAGSLLVYEREIPTVDDPSAAAALRVEAGRLCERLGDTDRARSHYDAALLADPRATPALRGLRRLARAQGDLGEATRQLEAEIAVAGALERRPLGHYRVDLLMASGEHDLARVAVGELLDTAPSDVRALLAQLELAFLDGRADEFGKALEQLAHAVTDNELRAAVQQARATLAAHHNDGHAAVTWFNAATESDPGSLGARFGAIREAAAQRDGEAAAKAMVDLASSLVETDPATAASLALRAQHHQPSGAIGTAASQLAMGTMANESLVARTIAEAALASGDVAQTAAAMTVWSNSEAPIAERAYAAARAAELDPGHGAELWGLALQLDPDDDYASAQLRTAYVAAEQTQLAIEVDLAAAQDPERERARLRAAFGMVAQNQLEDATRVLEQGYSQRHESIAVAEALAEAFAAAGRWSDRAKLLAAMAAEPGDQLDKDVATLRSALAWEEAVGAASATENPDQDEIQSATAAALGAWERVIEHAQGNSPMAHAAAIVLATRLGDRDVTGDVLTRAQKAERSPWAGSSLALRRARLASDDPARVDAILNEAAPRLDDPRRTVVQMLAAARRKDTADLATTLDERAALLGSTPEAAALRLRAAQIFLDAGDAMRATGLLRTVERALPGVTAVSDLLNAARRRAGDASGPMRVAKEQRTGPVSPDEFARVVRDADDAAARNDGANAIGLYQSALEMRPGDPLAMVPLVLVATQLREPEPLAALALAQLRAAEAAGDGTAKAEAYEVLAHIDRELRNDSGSAQVALESALQADPTRVDLMHRLEREYTVSDQIGELLRLRKAELEQIPVELAKDRAAMLMDTAGLAERDQRPDAELTELYRDVLAADPRHRLALLHLESIVRRAGASEELAKLEEQIAIYFEGEARTQAAFFTRAGETLTELGKIDEAVQKFGKADEVLPGHVPALEGWRQAAIKGQLWIDVAEAATRQASVASDAKGRAALHHFSGVVLMDKALIGDKAMSAFRRALDADPGHRDSFLRMRLLLEEDGNHDELAILLGNRLEHEPDGPYKIEIQRALANLLRNFLSDRDGAKRHFRDILAADPNDLRAHAAIADIAWEQGAWGEAADALIARARLERDPEILKTLCFRLGLIYADRIIDVPMALKAFQRALTYQPDDEATLVRLADLATQAGEWKLALGACERLVKNEQDADKRAAHLHRVARIFKLGFGDTKRAERALNLALDGAPTNDDALSELVAFYRDAGDMTSVRVHLNRVAGTMRVRAGNNPKDGVAYRVISRAMAARAAVGVAGSLPIARAAAELADMLGASGQPERLILDAPVHVDLAPLLRAEADDVLFPRGVQTELRQLFKLLGDRLAKHVGIDLRAYGVGRGDRLRARDSTVAAHAQDVATGLGFGEIDVYVSVKQPYAMVAEPTSPASLVIGQAIAQLDSRAVRFASGAALKLAQTHLAIPARLPADDLGVLVIALLRMFVADFPTRGLDEPAIGTQMQKLKRLIPTGLATELRPFAFAIDPLSFSHLDLARDLRVAGLRAGLIAAGSLMAGLNILAAQAQTDVPSFLADPVAQGLVSFALSEDHATLVR
jgi:tetratricopeptide (TPR) repeat protein